MAAVLIVSARTLRQTVSQGAALRLTVNPEDQPALVLHAPQRVRQSLIQPLVRLVVAPATAPGAAGAPGADGAPGAAGAPGVGVPVGGTTGQVLVKSSNTDHATIWTAPTVPWGAITGTLSAQTDLQTALNGKQAAGSYAAAVHGHAQADVTNLVSDLVALAGGIATKLNASAVSAYGLTLIDDADAATARGTLGLGTLATQSVSELQVTFATPSTGQFFDVALAGATVGQKVLASVSLNMPAGISEDELEMDPLVVFGHVATAGQVRLFVGSASGRGTLFGARAINVTLS